MAFHPWGLTEIRALEAELATFTESRWSSRSIEGALRRPLGARHLLAHTSAVKIPNPDARPTAGNSLPSAPRNALLAFLVLAWLVIFVGGMFQTGFLDDAYSGS